MERIFGRVTDAEDAKEAIDWCSGIFYLFAVIQAALALFDGRAHLVDAAILAGLATWLRMGNSRIAAALLMILAVLSAVVALMSAPSTPPASCSRDGRTTRGEVQTSLGVPSQREAVSLRSTQTPLEGVWMALPNALRRSARIAL
jgi:hypothetical protein